MGVRLSRAEQTLANREAILTAAREQFEAHGYHGASVDGIAAAAGFSKGAIYSQFGSKDDLMLAVLETRIHQRDAEVEAFIAAAGADLQPADVVRQALGLSIASLPWQVALLEFRIHAWRNPAINARYQALHQRTIDKVARTMAVLGERIGGLGRHTEEQVAVAFLAGGTGMVIERLVDPDLDPIDYVERLAVLAAKAVSDDS